MSTKVSSSFEKEGESLVKSKVLTAEGHGGLDVTLTASELNKQYTVDLDVSELGYMYIQSDKDVIIYTNDAGTGSPAETIAIKANTPYLWDSDQPWVNLFATDLTDWYITNSEATAAVVTARWGYDATP